MNCKRRFVSIGTAIDAIRIFRKCEGNMARLPQILFARQESDACPIAMGRKDGKRRAAMTFEERLRSVQGKVHRVNFARDFDRFGSGLLYYWNCAEPLKDSARIIWDAKEPNNVAAMLIGMAIELLLKGTHVALDEDISYTHDLCRLSEGIGVTVVGDDRIILQALSEQITWAARYPTPTSERLLHKAAEIFGRQRRQSGTLANLFIESRDLSRRNCERFWGVYADYYERARQVRIESVEII